MVDEDINQNNSLLNSLPLKGKEATILLKSYYKNKCSSFLLLIERIQDRVIIL